MLILPKEEPSNLRTESLKGSEGSLSYNEKLFLENIEETEEEEENCVVFFLALGTISDKVVSAIAAQRNWGKSSRLRE